MGVVRSQEFNLIENPRLFFLALAAITECNMERFRYKPMILPPPTMTSPTVGPPLHLDGWEIHIDHGIDADNILVPGVAKMKITGDPLYVQPGIVGRGTSVIPVTVIPGHEFVGLKAMKKLVVKFSWPVASRMDLRMVFCGGSESVLDRRMHDTSRRCYCRRRWRARGWACRGWLIRCRDCQELSRNVFFA